MGIEVNTPYELTDGQALLVAAALAAIMVLVWFLHKLIDWRASRAVKRLRKDV